MLGYPLTPLWGPRRLTGRPTYPPPPSSRPPKVFAPDWGLEFEQAAPLAIFGLFLAGGMCVHLALLSLFGWRRLCAYVLCMGHACAGRLMS